MGMNLTFKSKSCVKILGPDTHKWEVFHHVILTWKPNKYIHNSSSSMVTNVNHLEHVLLRNKLHSHIVNCQKERLIYRLFQILTQKLRSWVKSFPCLGLPWWYLAYHINLDIRKVLTFLNSKLWSQVYFIVEALVLCRRHYTFL